MDLHTAKDLALELFSKFAKTKDPRFNEIHFKFDDATHRAGACISRFNGAGEVIPVKGVWATVVLSSRYVVHNTEKEIRDTILHESAHTLTNFRHGRIVGKNGKRESHGLKWKKVALELGAKPRSCTDEAVYIPKHLQIVCRNDKCKRNGIKVGEMNHSAVWFCKCCKKILSVEPNDMIKRGKPGIGEIIIFD